MPIAPLFRDLDRSRTWVIGRDFDNALTATRRQQLAEFRNTMSDLEGVFSEARDMVHRLARYIDDLERDPARALFGKSSGAGYRPK